MAPVVFRRAPVKYMGFVNFLKGEFAMSSSSNICILSDKNNSLLCAQTLSQSFFSLFSSFSYYFSYGFFCMGNYRLQT